jgi:hypothetical protein
MPDSQGKPLQPLPNEAFEYGEKYTITLEENKKCPSNHKNVTYDDAKREVRCSCGAVWSGHDVYKLYLALKEQ